MKAGEELVDSPGGTKCDSACYSLHLYPTRGGEAVAETCKETAFDTSLEMLSVCWCICTAQSFLAAPYTGAAGAASSEVTFKAKCSFLTSLSLDLRQSAM